LTAASPPHSSDVICWPPPTGISGPLQPPSRPGLMVALRLTPRMAGKGVLLWSWARWWRSPCLARFPFSCGTCTMDQGFAYRRESEQGDERETAHGPARAPREN
jgi:hypothetical protein